MARKILIRTVVVALVGAGLAYLLVATARDVGSEPYLVRQEQMRGWTVAIDDAPLPESGLIVLTPPHAMPAMLVQQIFNRRMEALLTPTMHGLPLLLRREFEEAFSEVATPDELVALAVETGLESASFTPGCLGARRAGASQSDRVFYVPFEAEAFHQFRNALDQLLESRGGDRAAYSAGAVPPLLVLTATGRALREWVPTEQYVADDCLAPVAFE